MEIEALRKLTPYDRRAAYLRDLGLMKAYNQGIKAGGDIFAKPNPYYPNTPHRLAWNDGFRLDFKDADIDEP